MLKETKPEIGKRYFIEVKVERIDTKEPERPFHININPYVIWVGKQTKFYTIEPEQEQNTALFRKDIQLFWSKLSAYF